MHGFSDVNQCRGCLLREFWLIPDDVQQDCHGLRSGKIHAQDCQTSIISGYEDQDTAVLTFSGMKFDNIEDQRNLLQRFVVVDC